MKGWYLVLVEVLVLLIVMVAVSAQNPAHDADTNFDGCVDLGEIVAYVELWQNSLISIQQVVDGVEQWQRGCNVCKDYACCSDSDCDDNFDYSQDQCFLPATTQSFCRNFVDYDRNQYFSYCWGYDCCWEDNRCLFDEVRYPLKKLPTVTIPNRVELQPRSIKGSGQISIIIVHLFAYDPMLQEYIDILRGSQDNALSLNYAGKWFEDEAQKRSVDLNIDLSFSEQQYKLPENFIIVEMGDEFKINLYEYILNNLPQYKDYDIIVPFYYSSSVYSPSASPHATSEQSFSLFSQLGGNGKVSIDGISRSFVHELSHLFGASDKYTCLNINSISCEYAKQDGAGCIIESDDPLEKGRDIMCHRVADYFINGTPSGFHLPYLDELTVIDVTAKEIGWYDADGDGIVEVEDPCPFLANNIC